MMNMNIEKDKEEHDTDIETINRSRLLEELEFLQSIYFEEVQYSAGTRDESLLTMKIHPATAGNTAEQFVCITLEIKIPVQYPDVSPHVVYKNPRGLSDDACKRLELCIQKIMAEHQGEPVLLHIFESVRDLLSDSNIPHGNCAICHCGFGDEGEEFLKTGCYHYFHLTCFARYKQFWQDNLAQADHVLPHEKAEEPQFECPVCRQEIPIPDISIEDVSPDNSETVQFVPDKALKELQHKWKTMYNIQLANGGIIDLEAEKAKYYIPSSTSTTSTSSITALATEIITKETAESTADNEISSSEKSSTSARSNNSNRRRGHGGKGNSYYSEGTLRKDDSRKGFMARNRQYQYESRHRKYEGSRDSADARKSEQEFECDFSENGHQKEMDCNSKKRNSYHNRHRAHKMQPKSAAEESHQISEHLCTDNQTSTATVPQTESSQESDSSHIVTNTGEQRHSKSTKGFRDHQRAYNNTGFRQDYASHSEYHKKQYEPRFANKSVNKGKTSVSISLKREI